MGIIKANYLSFSALFIAVAIFQYGCRKSRFSLFFGYFLSIFFNMGVKSCCKIDIAIRVIQSHSLASFLQLGCQKPELLENFKNEVFRK